GQGPGGAQAPPARGQGVPRLPARPPGASGLPRGDAENGKERSRRGLSPLPLMDWPIVSFAMLAAALAGHTLFAFLATAAGVFALLFSAAAAFFGRRFLNSLKSRASAASLPPVTVIKPLKGAEGPLYDNLASFCRQQYPCFQLVFCLQSPDDPALGVVSRLKREFPGVDMEVVVSKNRIGYNPKVNNMANG